MAFIIRFVIVSLLYEIMKVEGGGTMYIRFLSYSNPTHKDDAGQCCESLSTSGCGANECDPFFKICVERIGSSGCEYGQIKTEVHDNTDSIRFGNLIRTMPNPIVKTFSNWGSGIDVKVDVVDKDSSSLLDSDDPIGSISYRITGPVDQNGILLHNTTRSIQGGAARIVLQYSIVCESHYYADCSVSCRPELPKYNCSSRGQRICLPGWVGFQCNTPDNSCTTRPCHNGATCSDVPPNGFRCTCIRGWTGQTCETFALSPSAGRTTLVSMTSSPLTTLTSISQNSTRSSTQKLNTSSSKAPAMLTTQNPVTSPSQRPFVLTSLKPMTPTTQKLDTSSTQRPVILTTQESATSSTQRPVILTTQESATSSTQRPVILTTQESATSSTQRQITTAVPLSSGHITISSTWLVNVSTSTTSAIPLTTSRHNVTGVFCHIKVDSYLINGTNVTRIQLSGFNKTGPSAEDIEGVLQHTVYPTSLRPVSFNESVMVFDLEITNTTSTSTLLSRAQKDICRRQIQTPGFANGRNNIVNEKDNSSNTGAVIGGVLGAIIVLVLLGTLVFFLYRWHRKQRKVTDNTEHDALPSTCKVQTEDTAVAANTSPTPVSPPPN